MTSPNHTIDQDKQTINWINKQTYKSKQLKTKNQTKFNQTEMRNVY